MAGRSHRPIWRRKSPVILAAQGLGCAAMISLEGKTHYLGDGFFVTRLLPDIARRSVGPFLFFDYFGPVSFAPGKGIDVRPHPHIGLATVTYLFEGSQIHRDTLGSAQEI